MGKMDLPQEPSAEGVSEESFLNSSLNFPGWEQAACARAQAHPSLALIKYWGKADSELNIPATPSLALSLNALTTTTKVWILRPAGQSGPSGQFGPSGNTSRRSELNDQVFINAAEQPRKRFEAFFAHLRRELNDSASALSDLNECRFLVRSTSNFPSSAGLASSASGFAALTAAACAASGADISRERMSAIARVGSASAARCFWGGFVRLDEGALNAEPAAPENWWPELRVVILLTDKSKKPLSSRRAMELCRQTSPFYPAWVENSRRIMQKALKAVKNKDLEELGTLMRQSYMQMFSTMFSANPPLIYWNPLSLTLLRRCEEMRAQGIPVWETMDAGPQVKLLCTAESLKAVLQNIKDIPNAEYRVSEAGAALKVNVCE